MQFVSELVREFLNVQERVDNKSNRCWIYTGCFVTCGTSGADCTPKNNEKKVLSVLRL